VWHSLVSWLLGINRGEIAQGTGVRLKFANPWPTWAILLFALGAIWLVFFLYSREKGTATRRRKICLAVVRCLILALVLLVLFKPILAVDKSELKQAYVVVLLDDSLSMQTRDQYRDAKVRLALARAAGLVAGDAKELSPDQDAPLDQLTRADLVNRVLANPSFNLLGRLDRQCKLRVAAFADSVRGLGPDAWRPASRAEMPVLVVPRGTRTLLGAALGETADGLRGHRIAAVIVVSDGRTQDADPTALEVARRLGALHGEPFPVFTVGVGAADEGRDIEVVKILAPTTAKKDDQVTFNAIVTSKGFEGEVEVQLNRDGQLVKTLRAELEARDGPQTITIPYTPEETGTFRFSVAIPAEPDELSTENNAAQHVLTVKDAKTKVLFVAGSPSYFYRFLKNTLLVDRSVQLSCILQSADPDFHQEGNNRITRYPDSRRELFEYDVVVFSDVDPSMFTDPQLADLRAFVGQFGGGFILVAGQFNPVEVWAGTPLEELLPVVLGGSGKAPDLLAARTLKEAFRPRLTEQGRTHGITRLAGTRGASARIWENFPGCYWYHAVTRAKPGTVVLVEHPYDRDERGAMPLVVVGRYDPGRTLFCALDGTWRWRFWVGDAHFNRFWVQAIDYVGSYRILGGSRRVQLATDKRVYTIGQRVVVQAQCLDDSFQPSQSEALEAKVEMQGAPAHSVRLVRSRQGPGIYEGSFEARRAGGGVVSVSVGAAQDSLSFNVRLPENEFRNRTMDAATLRDIAEVTRGSFVRLHEIHELDDRVQAAGQEITSEIQDPVFDAPLVVIVFLGLICSEWWFRKRGMLA